MVSGISAEGSSSPQGLHSSIWEIHLLAWGSAGKCSVSEPLEAHSLSLPFFVSCGVSSIQPVTPRHPTQMPRTRSLQFPLGFSCLDFCALTLISAVHRWDTLLSLVLFLGFAQRARVSLWDSLGSHTCGLCESILHQEGFAGPVKMAQHLRGISLPAEDPGSLLSTHKAVHNCL